MIVHCRVPCGQVHVDDSKCGDLQPYVFQTTAIKRNEMQCKCPNGQDTDY